MTHPIEICPHLREDHRQAAAKLYWQAFGAKLGKVLGPEARAVRFFSDVMRADHALSAISPTGDLLGIAGFKTENGAFVGGELSDLTRRYGKFGGVWRGLVVSVLDRQVETGVLLMDGICVARRRARAWCRHRSAQRHHSPGKTG